MAKNHQYYHSFPHPCGSSPVIKIVTMEGKNNELKRNWHRSSDWNSYTLSHLAMRFPNTKTQGWCAEHSLVRRHCTKALRKRESTLGGHLGTEHSRRGTSCGVAPCGTPLGTIEEVWKLSKYNEVMFQISAERMNNPISGFGTNKYLFGKYI